MAIAHFFLLLGEGILLNLKQSFVRVGPGASFGQIHAHWSILSQKRHKVLKIDPFEISFLLFFLELYKKVLGKPYLF